ncbi:sensor histidine kinase [Agitococcus lubricus]|uniref:histidine kinase n=1 Tax=Agitococcus lubricus TaxID=1077255 RepID=A0A2T5J040_9GAMM|nr:histidine kinase [Agitococcus lubricus]PTQ89685.1 signal transduction histidine kinase [Agitococcus lubricus]
MHEAIPFLRRQPLIIMFGVLAWLLAVWQLSQAAMAQGVVFYFVLIALNGIAALLALLRLLWLIITTRRWQMDNRDSFLWLCIIIGYGSAFMLAHHMVLPAIESFFLGFLLFNFSPLLNRFSPWIANGIFIITSLVIALLQHTLPVIVFTLYLLLAQSALWYMSYCNLAEWQAHLETATAHAQLRATQQLLNDAVARNERTRIARDLHDQMGHHLVALNIQLQILERKLPEQALPELVQVQDLAKELFKDVRTTVQQLRADQASFSELLESMLSSIPFLEFDVDIDADLAMLDEQLATCLLRVVQEAITNSLKHSDACRLWIRLVREPEGLRLMVKDNGRLRKNAEFSSGNGLRGLGERIGELGGALQTCATHEGFMLAVQFPEDCLS